MKQAELFEDFLGGLLTFQTFPEKKTGAFPHVRHGSLAQWGKQLEAWNKSGSGVFVTVNETNGQGRTASDIVRVRCVFVDLDGAPLSPVLDDMPDLVVETSPKKYHAYWRVKDFPLEGFKQTQQAIAEKYQGDTKVCDLPRVMRLPGFYHRKGEPFLTRIVYKPPPKFLTFADCVAKWPPKPRKKFSAPKYQKTMEGDFRGVYGAPEGQRNAHVMRRLCGALKRGLRLDSLWDEAVKEGAACSPPLGEREIQQIYNSVSRYAK